MDSVRTLLARDSSTPNETIVDLLIAILCLVFLALILGGLLFMLRRKRRQQQKRQEALPQYHEVGRSSSNLNHRSLTIQTTHLGEKGRASVVIYRDGQPMLANPGSPPHSPDNVPEIHITFPDEQDEQGRPKSGRVVVVRVGETGTVGLEPLHDQLPAYERESSSQFYAIDIEKIGGLKEKEDYY